MYRPKLYQIITDMDDQDMYKYTLCYFIFKNFSTAKVKWELFNRGNHRFPKGFAEELKNQISGFKDLSFTQPIEDNFRKQIVSFDKFPLFNEEFYDYLKSFRYNLSEVTVTQEDDKLSIEIEGGWLTCKHWETQLMPTIVELYNLMEGYEMKDGDVLKDGKLLVSCKENEKIIRDKFDGFRKLGAKVADFGLRRRAFKDYHDLMLSIASTEYPDVLTGTSNMHFSRKYNIKSIGTMAHSINMFMATLVGPSNANALLLKLWTDTFNGNLSTVLPDCFTTDNFLKNFNMLYSKIYDSRQDSGDVNVYTDKLINHYKSKGIDAQSKSIIYSNGIDSLKIVEDILNYRKGEIKKGFGIGTWLTFDIPFMKPMNIVIKMTQANPDGNGWKYCCKIPDDLGKCTYRDQETLKQYLTELSLNVL